MLMYKWLMPTLEELSQRLGRSKLHHGILLMGDIGCGESSLAIAMANRILCQAPTGALACGKCKGCLLFKAQSHPDFHEVTTDKTQIGVDAIRQAIDKVTKTAQLGANKVVLIEQIERMTESASNALLKTLEEPTDGTFLILTTNAPQYLLATIKSRCEKIRVPMPSFAQSESYLLEQGLPVPTATELAAYQHSPLLYAEQYDQKAVNFKAFHDDFNSLVDGALNAHEAAEKWKDAATDAVNWTAQLCMQRFSLNVKQTIENSDTVVGAHWMQGYDKATVAGKKLRQAGLNKTLILAALFAQIQI
ncbi:DNA polymerase III subunit delta' [Glaciecola sp. XM2]|jgi:DNA polymerase-3 subunit delta'|uniref:DNA polymerase III subunit delta' n=1 Tax=Glaciecola sp. XM2 TaxID=1914931 RepID=UPI001BDE2FA4|nr:DNA polymerase III subunit delta' [Glaciecola sp. XM2]MBT1449559.1 DNA polymerase III subunit delta' [Glaciecola sp. XM2]